MASMKIFLCLAVIVACAYAEEFNQPAPKDAVVPQAEIAPQPEGTGSERVKKAIPGYYGYYPYSAYSGAYPYTYSPYSSYNYGSYPYSSYSAYPYNAYPYYKSALPYYPYAF